MTVHPAALSAIQKGVLRQLGPVLTQQGFYLAGRTALALQMGHRRSVDLDWFTMERIADPMLLAQELREAGISLLTGQVERGTLHGTVSRVRVTFLEYRYPLLTPALPSPEFGCSLASLDDLACMKLSAVSQRGAKKDFVDVYALGLRHRTLMELLRLYQQKYSVEDIAHVLYGLSYFDEADQERMPHMLWRAGWRTIKQTIRHWVKEVAR
jgi:hypothetical protein